MHPLFDAAAWAARRLCSTLLLSLGLCVGCAAEKKDFMASASELESRTLFAPAMRDYEEAIEKNPDNPELQAEAQYRIGALANELGNSGFAAAKFREALEADAGHSAAKRALSTHHVKRGSVARQQGRLEDARRELLAAVQIDPGSSVAQLELGRTYEAEDRLDAALQAYEAAARADPLNIDTHLALGRGYLATQRYAQAVAALSVVLDGNPERADAHAGLGEAYFHQGQRERAKQSFDQAMRRYLLIGRRDLAQRVKDTSDALFGTAAHAH